MECVLRGEDDCSVKEVDGSMGLLVCELDDGVERVNVLEEISERCGAVGP